jgi:hypothetical protein
MLERVREFESRLEKFGPQPDFLISADQLGVHKLSHRCEQSVSLLAGFGAP